MKQYLAIRPPQAGPLFVNAVGKPLTKQALTLETRKLLAQAGFNASSYAGHSYRIDAATTAAAAKLPPWLIKTLGRWSSDCYERYIQIPSSTLLNVAAKTKTGPTYRGEGFSLWEMRMLRICGDGVLPKVTLNPIDSHKTMYYIHFIVINYGDSLPLACLK